MKVLSYAFAVVAGICFASGVFILSSEGDNEYGATRNDIGYV